LGYDLTHTIYYKPDTFYDFNVSHVILSDLQIYNQEALYHPTFGIE